MNFSRRKARKIKKIELLIFASIVVLLMCLLFNLISKRTLQLLQGNNKYIDLAVDAGTKNSDNYTIVTSLDGVDVPVPTGFVASSINSEMSVATGFVIYEGDEVVPNDDSTEEGKKLIRRAQNTRNQYVWIPVSTEMANKLYRITDDGIIYANKLSITNNGYSVVTDSIVEPVISLNDKDFGNATDIPLFNWRKGKTSVDVLSSFRQKFYETMVSIKTYGGYYIARYESPLTIDGELMSRRYVDYQRYDYSPFYKMYNGMLNLKNGNESVDTHLIWDVLWDCSLICFVESGTVSYKDVNNVAGSRPYGNYKNSSFTYDTLNSDYTLTSHSKASGSTTLIPTGSSEQLSVYNVFDMAGNYYEFTMANSVGNKNRSRGSVYTDSRQFTYVTESRDKGGHEVASRAILYIK